MIQVINDNFVRQSASLSQIIDRKINVMRQELMDKMADQQRELEDLRARVQAVEARPSPADDSVTQRDLTPIYRRMEAVESSLTTNGCVDRLAAQRLIVKGLPEAQNEGLEDPRQQCQQLMTELQLQIRMAKVEHLGSMGAGRRKPRPVALTLSNVDDVKNIMWSTRNLKYSERYSWVYI